MVSSSEASYIIESCLDDFRIDGRSRSEYRPYSISNNSSSRRRSSSHLSRKNGGGGGERHDDVNDDDRRPPRPVQRVEQGTPSRIVHRRSVQRQGRPHPSVVVKAERGSLQAVRRPVAVVWRNRRRRRTVATTGGGGAGRRGERTSRNNRRSSRASFCRTRWTVAVSSFGPDGTSGDCRSTSW